MHRGKEMSEIFKETDVLLPDLWCHYATHSGDRIALSQGDRAVCWRDFNRMMNLIANALLSIGVGKGNRVAVLMPSRIETVEIMFGIVKAGACVVPLSSMLTPQQIAVMLDDSGAEVVFADETTRPLIDGARSSRSGATPLTPVGLGAAGEGWRAFEDFIAGASDAEPPVSSRLSDVFSIIYSSGTTGTPKGIAHTHRARMHFALSNALEMAFDSTTRALVSTSLYTTATWIMILPTLLAGGTLVILPQFTPTAFVETVHAAGISHAFIVPTQIAALLRDPVLDGTKLGSLRCLLSAGSTLTPSVKEELARRITPRLFELYGCSEGVATLLRPEHPVSKTGSVGKPHLGHDIRIVGADDWEAGTDEPGEICGFSAGLLAEYLGKADLTREAAWCAPDGRPFFRTGDIGRIDADGFIYILGRKKDMIISGGLNIYPADIEAVIGDHPDVQEVAVVGVPHEKWGETPVALIVMRAGSASTEQDILSWLESRLAKHQRPTRAAFVDNLKRNMLGKLLKREIRDDYLETLMSNDAQAQADH
jgi:acyl-CoA synthetase (AMP-forming)/AMP-acid ligase II